MKIRRLIGGNLESNGYIIYDKEKGEAYVIDPGYNPGSFLKELDRLGLTAKGILLTHHHYDHTGGVEGLRQALSCPVYLHRDDWDIYKKPVDFMLEHGQIVTLGEEEILVLHTPGHTWGGVCFYSDKSKLAFTGDTLFNVDMGRTDLLDGSEQALAASVRDVMDKWGNDITIYPGHGDPATMKFVRKNNQEYQERSKGGSR